MGACESTWWNAIFSLGQASTLQFSSTNGHILATLTGTRNFSESSNIVGGDGGRKISVLLSCDREAVKLE